jgi:hypothetical protein
MTEQGRARRPGVTPLSWGNRNRRQRAAQCDPLLLTHPGPP